MKASHRVWLVAVLVPAAAVAACSSTSNDAAPSGPGDASAADAAPSAPLPCDVDAVLAKGCRSCHAASPRFGAPMPLVSHSDLTAAAPSDKAKKVFERVRARVHDDAAPMPPAPAARLTAAELAVLDAWAAAGAPSGTGACADAGPGGDAGVVPLSCTPDAELRPAAAWEMPQSSTDTYVCYGVDLPVTSKRHIVGVLPRVDNATIVHHVLMMQSDTAVSPTPAPCAALPTNTRILYGWAPGGQGFELPPEAGLPLDPTSHFVVQVHYSNLRGLSGQRDASGFSLCTTATLRPNDADVMAFGTTKIDVPPRGAQDVTCDIAVPAAMGSFRAIAAFPHMHQLGKTITTTLIPAGGGAPVDLGAVASWQFSNQLWYPVSATVRPGDTVRTRCAWQNDTATRVRFGERTSDEMCFSFTMMYPKVQSAAWNWALPAAQSTCAPTP